MRQLLGVEVLVGGSVFGAEEVDFVRPDRLEVISFGF